MKKHPIKTRFFTHLDRIRKIVQLISLLFLVFIPIFNWFQIHWIIGNLYSISFGSLEITDPAMALQTVLLTREIYLPLFISVLIPVILAMILGKMFCSWACPYNTFAEWSDNLLKRFFPKRWRRVHLKPVERNLSPFFFWGVFLMLSVLVIFSEEPLFTYLSPPGILSAQISQSVLGMGIGLELLLVGIIFTIELTLFKRIWCSYICPVGATLALFRTGKTLKLSFNENQCDCKNSEPCHYACPLDLSPKRSLLYPSCYNCGKCISVCEQTGNCALSFKLK